MENEKWENGGTAEAKPTVDRPAGFWIRFGANLLDALLIGLPLFFISYLITGDTTQQEPFTDVLSFLYSLLVPVFWYGYTVGKKLVGIRIVKINGDPVGIGTMLMRNLVAGLFYVITIGIGLIISAFMVGMREDKRAIHDLIAKTYVTYNRP